TPPNRVSPGNVPTTPPGAQRPGPQAIKGNENRGKSEDARARERTVLKETMKRQSLKNPDRLRALLKTAPESVKPALNRAITLSEKAYEKALGSISAAEK
ncbi:MAG: hypothetical protein Q7R57_06540, partial [Dehalococcoidales bacterium]|nr:hypothetical protein [Dehalococcoidales bacterium]